MNSSKRSRYFHLMRRVHQQKEKTSLKDEPEQAKPVKAQSKSISSYFLPKSKGESQKAARDEVQNPTKKSKPCERTIQILSSFSAQSNSKIEDEKKIEPSAPVTPVTGETPVSRGTPVAGVSRKRERNLQVEDSPSPKKSNSRKPTPFEEQVSNLKSRHAGMVLMFECGYRYRFFGDDAHIASKVLDIMVIKDNDALYAHASVPTFNGANIYIKKLVSAGHKVGVVSQTETSAQKKYSEGKRSGLFQRSLTSVYTASTLVGEDVKIDELEKDSASGQRNYVMAVLEDKKEDVVFASIEPTTGEVFFDKFPRQSFEHRLAFLQPAEILIPVEKNVDFLSTKSREIILCYVKEQSFFGQSSVRIEEFDKTMYDVDRTQQKVFKNSEAVDGSSTSHLRQMWPSFDLTLARCFSGLFQYLTTFGLERSLLFSTSISDFKTARTGRNLHLPPLTIRNLEVFETAMTRSLKGSLFQAVNCTQTRFGARMLRDWMSAPLTDVKAINDRLDVVEYLSNIYKDDFNQYRDILHSLPDLHLLLVAAINRKIQPSVFSKIVTNLTKVVDKVNDVIKSLTDSCSKERPELLSRLLVNISVNFSELSSLTSDINLTSAAKNEFDTLFAETCTFAEIESKRREIERFYVELESHKSEICRTLGLFAFSYSTVAGVDYLVEVSPPTRKVPNNWLRMNATKSCVRYRTPLITETLPKLEFAQECLLRESQKAWSKFLDSKVEIFRSLLVGLKGLAQIDCLLSLSMVARRDGFCRPVFSESRRMCVRDSRNIIVEHFSAAEKQYVPNDIEFGDKAILLTGPNMGGKSCYIRQVAMVALLAQIGSFVPASSAELPIFDAIFLRVGARDNLWAGKSTLAVELDEAGLILRQATSRSLVLLDELGRGTSTFDGVAIASAVLRHLVQRTRCTTLLVTHYRKLTENSELVENFHMGYQTVKDSDDENDDVIFLYKLTPGPTESSFGLNVAKMAGLPDSITKMATKIADHYENGSL